MPEANQILPRVPTVQLHFEVPSVMMPFTGCFPGDGNSYVGKQFANRPDLLKLNAIKQFKKDIVEKILTMTIGSKDNPARATEFGIEIIRLGIEIDQALDAFEEVVGAVTEELDAAISLANEKFGEVNQLAAELLQTPAEARSAVQRLMIRRYAQYGAQLEAHASRLESANSCLGVF